MKKIYFLVSNDLNTDQRMIRICTALQSQGYDCELVGRQLPQSQPLHKQPFAQYRFNCFFNKGKFFYLELNLRLFFFLLFKKYDAVCAIDLDTILPAYYVAKWRGKKLIYDAHEYFSEVPEVINRPRTKKIWEWVANRTIPNCRHAYTVCQSLADIFLERYKTHFEVIRNVPFANKENADLVPINTYPPQPFILLYQGVLNEGRGLAQLIAAMPNTQNVLLWIAGEGDISAELRALVQGKNLQDKVIFLGKIAPHLLKEKTAAAHLGVNLLENKSLNYYYSLANKCFDYIQAHKPALNMDFPEYQRINHEYKTSVLLPDLAPATILNAIQTLQNDANLYAELQKNTVEAAQIYTWEREQIKLFAFYERVFS